MGNICDYGTDQKSLDSSLIQDIKTPQNQEMQQLQPQNKNKSMVHSRKVSSQNLQQMEGKKGLSTDDFIKVDLLGQGAFGKVFRVKKKDNGKIYAMKQMEKKQIFQNKLEHNIVLERNVLKQSKHPFIVQLKYAFQTSRKIYFIMEYVSGGEFYNILKMSKEGFPEHVVKFVTAEVILGLEYLNTKLKVIYRDLKPENILLSTKGHVKITDFGLATLRKENEKSFTIAGTPEYLAPEILTKKGHSYEVDIWTLGILIYEMINGYPPFQDPQRNFERIKSQIIANQPYYTQKMSNEAKDLIKKLLQTHPEDRLGVQGGYQEIKNHPFFSGIKWEQLYNLESLSPLKTFAEQNAQRLEKRAQHRNQNELKFTPNNTQLSVDRHILGITYTGDGQTYNSKC